MIATAHRALRSTEAWLAAIFHEVLSGFPEPFRSLSVGRSYLVDLREVIGIHGKAARGLGDICPDQIEARMTSGRDPPRLGRPATPIPPPLIGGGERRIGLPATSGVRGRLQRVAGPADLGVLAWLAALGRP